MPDTPDNVTADEILATLREETSTEALRAALKRARLSLVKKEQNTRELVEAVYRAANDAGLAASIPTAPKLKASGREEVALLHLTDWQYGKVTSEYNQQVCSDRVLEAVGTAVQITDMHRSSRPVSEVHLMLGGDMVEGTTIFPGQAWQVEGTIYDQLFGVVSVVQAAVQALLKEFTKVTVWEEYGNHGRIGRKGEQPSQDNIDLMAYRIAQRSFPQSDRIDWRPATSWHQIVNIGEYSALLVHGDEINSYGGNHPSYGIVKKVQAWQAGVTAPFRDCYMGHFHRPDTYTLASGGSVYITGSTESGNEYAREFMAATGRPSQRLHMVDPVKGRVTAEHRIWLD